MKNFPGGKELILLVPLAEQTDLKLTVVHTLKKGFLW